MVAKILQVCNTDFYLSKFLRPLVLTLVDEGFEVHVATEGDNIPADVRAACRIYPVSFPRHASVAGFRRAIGELRNLIRRENYDIVNGHNRNGSISARIAAWLEKTPVNLYTAHGFYFHDHQGPLGWGATVALEAVLARITDHTLSQSDRDTRLMKRLHLIARDRIETIGNGIDTAKFTVEESRNVIEARLGLAKGKFRVVSVGRIVAGKGFGDLVDAFARFVSADPARGNSELVIVGGNIEADISPAADHIRHLLDHYQIFDKVRITGLVNNVQDWLYASDLFVSPSYREGMPRALLEAMCSRLPVIATDIRGSSEIVEDGVNGFIYKAKNVAGCEAALTAMYLDADRREAMRDRNRALVLEKYSEEAYTARQVAAIKRLCGCRSPNLDAVAINLDDWTPTETREARSPYP